MEYVKSQRGKDLLEFEHYFYRLNRESKTSGVKYFKCRNNDCKGTLHVIEGIPTPKRDHNHEDDRVEIAKKKLKNKLKEKVSIA